MIYLYEVMWYCLVIIAIIFFIFGLDGVFLDIYYTYYQIKRYFKTRKYKPLIYEQLANHPEQKIAIIVPCWQEANVIGDMLRHNVRAIDYQNYTLFIGVYPNDPDTIAAVQKTAEELPHICCVIGPRPGPTTKADNLNAIYEYLLGLEKSTQEQYQIIVLHDSEDMIHPLSLKLYNYLIPRKDMIQIPVFPLEVNYLNFTHWIYNDEFAEYHTKDIIVREAIHGLVPSAGVGTAFSRKTLDMLIADSPEKIPFALGHLTEDYNTSLKIRLARLKSIFATQWVMRTKYRRGWLGFGWRKRKIKEYIATRALFPTEYIKAVRQKSRWIIGIAIQEWLETGWKGDLPTRYTLFTDRKSLFTHLINGFSYLVLIFWLLYSWWQFYHPQYPSLQEKFNQFPVIWYLILACTIMMCERLLQRVIATWKIYGMIPALLSIPRAIYANLLNLHAVLRAYRQFFFNPKNKKQPKWDKTDHIFAASPILQSSRKKLGEYLVAEGILSGKECIDILSEQMKTGERMGDLLIRKGVLSKPQLFALLAQQYSLELLTQPPVALTHQQLASISAHDYKWLLANGFMPIQLSADNVLHIAITDPANTSGMDHAQKILSAYTIKCVLNPYN